MNSNSEVTQNNSNTQDNQEISLNGITNSIYQAEAVEKN